MRRFGVVSYPFQQLMEQFLPFSAYGDDWSKYDFNNGPLCVVTMQKFCFTNCIKFLTLSSEFESIGESDRMTLSKVSIIKLI